MTEQAASRLIRLPDQRLVDVWEGGDPEGVPIIFHHGTPASRLSARLGDEAARRHGVRLMSFNRPGYGRSTDTPPSLASVGFDTSHVADEMGVDEFAVFGVSGGGPYAIATGLADPDRVRAAGVVAGIGPWRLIEPSWGEDPDLPLLALADAGDVGGALAGFRAQGGVAFDVMLRLGDDAMVEEYFDGAPAEDIGWLDPTAKTLWAADLREALRSYDGYARDNVAWGGKWDIDPTALNLPSWLWYGEVDRMVPATHGHWLAERIPESTLVIRRGAGHGSTSFEYWDDIFETLRSQL